MKKIHRKIEPKRMRKAELCSKCRKEMKVVQVSMRAQEFTLTHRCPTCKKEIQRTFKEPGVQKIEFALSQANKNKATAVNTANMVENLANELLLILQNCPEVSDYAGVAILNPWELIDDVVASGGASGYYFTTTSSTSSGAEDCNQYVAQAENAQQQTELFVDEVKTILGHLQETKSWVTSQCSGMGLGSSLKEDITNKLPEFKNKALSKISSIEERITSIEQSLDDYKNCKKIKTLRDGTYIP